MKIDIKDIKFWMDAIRNSDDRSRTLESFWGGQLESKTISNANAVIHGGWNGVLANMLFNSEIGIKHIISVDLDPVCKKIASTVNKRQEMEGMFEAVTGDMCSYEYTTSPYFVINTSCEHITPEQYMQWLNNIPKGTKIVLQSNNYSELEEHVNCSETLDEFVKKSKLNVEVAKELQLTKYKRFMIIGTKDV
jgi:hypothetical protein